MKRVIRGALIVMFPLSVAATNCDITRFRWLCEEDVRLTPTRHAHSAIDCNGSTVYVTKQQYETIMRYQRASINMTLKVNGEYLTSPCVPAGYYGIQ